MDEVNATETNTPNEITFNSEQNSTTITLANDLTNKTNSVDGNGNHLQYFYFIKVLVLIIVTSVIVYSICKVIFRLILQYAGNPKNCEEK